MVFFAVVYLLFCNSVVVDPPRLYDLRDLITGKALVEYGRGPSTAAVEWCRSPAIGPVKVPWYRSNMSVDRSSFVPSRPL